MPSPSFPKALKIFTLMGIDSQTGVLQTHSGNAIIMCKDSEVSTKMLRKHYCVQVSLIYVEEITGPFS